jgi:predicted DNA-binding transcriptional regulator AlpA
LRCRGRHSSLTTPVVYPQSKATVNRCRLATVAPRVRTEDLVDAQGVADILGLSHRNTVSNYQKRYADMPRPVIDLGPGRPRLWLRSEIDEWARRRRPPKA